MIGGVAVNLHGLTGNTKDIDIWIGDDEVNRGATFEALKAYFEGVDPIEKSHFMSHKGVFVFGLSPNRVDLLTEVSGLEFEGVYSNRMRLERRGVEFSLVSADDLIALKKAANRLQDRADIRALRKFALQFRQDDSEEEN